jgi:hypothetical protein
VLKAGGCTVLLDGLDELGGDSQQQVRELVGSLKGNQIVVTSRPYAYRLAPLSDFKTYGLKGLEPHEVEELATVLTQTLGRYYDVQPLQALQRVLHVARGQATLIASNPLLLSFMCFTAVRKQADGTLEEFSTRGAPLIGECVDALVEWHRKHKVNSIWPVHLDGGGVSSILGKLALQSFKNQSGVIGQDDLGKLADLERSVFYEHLVPACFVMQRHQDYVFPVETLREYFASRVIAVSSDPYEIVRPYLHRSDWQRVILYTAGTLNRAKASRLVIWLPSFTWLFVKSVGPLVRALAPMIEISLQVAVATIRTDSQEGPPLGYLVFS